MHRNEGDFNAYYYTIYTYVFKVSSAEGQSLIICDCMRQMNSFLKGLQFNSSEHIQGQQSSRAIVEGSPPPPTHTHTQ